MPEMTDGRVAHGAEEVPPQLVVLELPSRAAFPDEEERLLDEFLRDRLRFDIPKGKGAERGMIAEKQDLEGIPIASAQAGEELLIRTGIVARVRGAGPCVMGSQSGIA